MKPVMDILDYINVDSRSDATLGSQIKRQVTWLIASGRLQPGDSLPSIRRLAKKLGINLHTVRSAYQMLESLGLVETRQSSGTHVLPFDPIRLSQAAGSLKSHTIGVILPSLSNPFYHGFLRGVKEVADQDQCLLFLCCTQDDLGEAFRYFAQLTVKGVDGMIVVSHDVSMILATTSGASFLTSGSIPLVSADWPGYPGYSVLVDLENAGYQATRHLLGLGHTRIGLITYNAEIPNVLPVNQGYQRALREAGIHLDTGLMAPVGGFDMAAGEEGARKLLAISNPPKAIFAIADTLAIGAMRTVKSMNLRIPQDVALVGFNDVPLAELVDPPLTTVVAPAYEMGLEAMKMLRRLVMGKQLQERQVILPTSLVIRESCGAQ